MFLNGRKRHRYKFSLECLNVGSAMFVRLLKEKYTVVLYPQNRVGDLEWIGIVEFESLISN